MKTMRYVHYRLVMIVTALGLMATLMAGTASANTSRPLGCPDGWTFNSSTLRCEPTSFRYP
jgi:hypothetical protein